MAMEVELEPMAASIGVTVPVLRFLLCFAATVPLSFLWRIVPGRLPKHLYSAGIGVSLSYISFGLSSNMHFLVLIMIGYSSMLLLRPRCGILTFFLGFGYLIGWMVASMTLFNYNDGLLKEEEGLREAQQKYRLTKLPSLVEYIGYCLCCRSHFAGAVFEMKDNLDWTEGKGIWNKEAKRPSPSPYGATIRALIQAGFCMALYLYLVPYFPLSRFTEPIYQEWAFWKKFGYQYMSRFTEPIYQEWAFWKKFGYQYMSGFTARWKYYFIWSVSEASIIISGLGFSGWANSSPPKPRWDPAKNVNILGVEFAKSSVVIPTVWNIQGVYPGYIIFFVQSALMIAGSRAIYRWQQVTAPSMANAFVFLNFAYTLVVINYSSVGFLVLNLHETLAAFGRVYYIGTILPILMILLGKVIKPRKPARSKAQKEQWGRHCNSIFMKFLIWD
ncbi:Lysophospholipid acyltransferase [Arachis hypogaea]|nr:Lysophospholipid acyltransferase [Arachis hypogaea]